MVCAICGKEFTEDWRRDSGIRKRNPVPKFCSSACAHSRPQTEDVRQKKAVSAKRFLTEHPDYRPTPPRGDAFLEARKRGGQAAGRKRREQRIHKIEQVLQDGGTRQDISNFRLLRELLIEKFGNVCMSCGQKGTWNGRPLTMQVHHEDGDCENNKLENLKLVCPNCHTQTNTYGSRNNGNSTRQYKVVYRKYGSVSV